jgi:hypothetical protein
VELLDFHNAIAPRRQGAGRTPTLKTHVFVPYFESDLASTNETANLADYLQACNSLILSRLRHIIDAGIHNGLQNRELMGRLFSQQIASGLSHQVGNLSEYCNSADCSRYQDVGQNRQR